MEEPTSSKSNVVWIIVGIVVALLCCCLLILAGAGVWLYQNGDSFLDAIPDISDVFVGRKSMSNLYNGAFGITEQKHVCF